MKKSLLVFIVYILSPIFLTAQVPEYHRYAVGIHYDTIISGGYFTVQELLGYAAENKLDAVIFCDHDRIRVEYGIPPLRNLVKKQKVEPSLITFGPENYLNMLKGAGELFPDITIIPGTEVGPGYYWSGNPLKKTLILHDWHQHMMVIGLENPADYYHFPSTASHIRRGFNSRILFDLLAVIGIFFGLMLFKVKTTKTIRLSLGQVLHVKRRPFKFTGIVIALFCTAILVNDFPFTARVYSPYNGNPNPAVSQALIDYVIDKGGLVYYAHPEAHFQGESDGIQLETLPYTDLLLKTENYTGFAVFGEGFHVAGAPGGEWDSTLIQYIAGKRAKPPWIVGEVDFEGDLPPEFVREVCTFVWAENKSKRALLDALAKGRCYAAQIFGSNFVWLDRWNISEPSGKSAISGEEISTEGDVTLHFDFTVAEGKNGFEALVIRNGEQIATIPFDESMTMDFDDIPPLGKSYYRLWVLYRGTPVVASNPIFVNASFNE